MHCFHFSVILTLLGVDRDLGIDAREAAAANDSNDEDFSAGGGWLNKSVETSGTQS